MRNLVCLSLLLLLFAGQAIAQNTGEEDLDKEACDLTLEYRLSNLGDELYATLQERPLSSVDEGIAVSQRSVKRAAFMSLVIPGTGEFYNRSYLKGLGFLALEAGAWTAYAIYTNRGNEKTDEFEIFADQHWDESKYWTSLAADAQSNGIFIDINDRQGLKDYERDSFSHFLPDTESQTYYENIGKYDQFNAGWDDGSGQARQRDSAHRESYTYMRKDANDQFRTATIGMTVALFNHVLSALDAAYSTHRHNQQARASMGLRIEKHGRDHVPAMSFSLSW